MHFLVLLIVVLVDLTAIILFPFMPLFFCENRCVGEMHFESRCYLGYAVGCRLG